MLFKIRLVLQSLRPHSVGVSAWWSSLCLTVSNNCTGACRDPHQKEWDHHFRRLVCSRWNGWRAQCQRSMAPTLPNAPLHLLRRRADIRGALHIPSLGFEGWTAWPELAFHQALCLQVRLWTPTSLLERRPLNLVFLFWMRGYISFLNKGIYIWLATLHMIYNYIYILVCMIDDWEWPQHSLIELWLRRSYCNWEEKFIQYSIRLLSH